MAKRDKTRRTVDVVMTGGGTAGHVFPGLSVAESMGSHYSFAWIGSRRGMERGLVMNAGIRYLSVPSGKWRRYLSLRNVVDIFKILLGFLFSLIALIRLRPLVLFSKGGYVTVPPVLAAHVLGIPVATHESDFDPGLATRINARFADRILVSYPQTVPFFAQDRHDRVTVSGNPVRRIFYEASADRGRKWLGGHTTAPLLLVMGGSSGARGVNRLIGDSLEILAGKCVIVHQTGPADIQQYQSRATQWYHPYSFLTRELPDLMAASTLVVSRAGANTLAELAATGRPAILIPLPTAGSRGDQIRNAESVAASGGALVFAEGDGTADQLAHLVLGLLGDGERLDEMGRAMASLATPDAADRIATALRDLMRRDDR